jgi:hypothetical protein
MLEFGVPGPPAAGKLGRALPLLRNERGIRVIRVIRGKLLLWRERGDDFFEAGVAA